MNLNPAVVVNKRSGFFSALVFGIFGLLITTVVCATSLGFYGLYIAHSNAGRFVTLAQDIGAGILEGVPDWIEGLPPVLSDALNDRRDPTYRDDLEIGVSVRASDDDRYARAVVTVRNEGDKTVSLLMARVVVLDGDGVPVRETMVPVATPLAFDDCSWPGPLLPGSERVLSEPVHAHLEDGFDAAVEITELRLWNGDETDAVRADRQAE